MLAKPQLENTILIDEVVDIMQNLGIPDSEEMPNEGGATEGRLEEDADEGSPTPEVENKPKKKGVDVKSLSDESQNLLLNFLIFLEAESMTVANFFSEVKYEQMVKTKKNKPSAVEIVPAEDFFRLLGDNDEISSDVDLNDKVKEELQDLL